MGQKTHPIGFRLGVDADVELALVRDEELRRAAARGREDPALHQGPALPRGHRARSTSSARPTGRGSRSPPRGPASSSAARAPRSRSSRTSCRCGRGKEIYLNIEEVIHPELDAQLVAENVALQLQKRVAFRRAMKKAVDLGPAAGRRRHPHRLRGPAGRRRDRAPRVVSRRAGAAAHAPRRHRLRAGHRPHDLRDDRREGVDLQGRGASRRAGGGLRDDAMLMPKRVKYRKAQRGRMQRQGPARLDARLRRVRAEGAGAGLGHQPPDRGGPRGAHPQPQARRQGVDPRVSRTSRSPRSRPRRAWARARATPRSGWRW